MGIKFNFNRIHSALVIVIVMLYCECDCCGDLDTSYTYMIVLFAQCILINAILFKALLQNITVTVISN